MKQAVLRGFILCLTLSVLLCGVLCAVIFDRTLTNTTESDMIRLVRLMSDHFDPEADHNRQAADFSRSSGGLRVTIIETDGTVTGDSDADYTTMENHADRAEIREALGTQTSTSIRSSETVGLRLIYAVTRTGTGQYIRIGQEYSGLARDLLSFLPAILLAAALSLLVSLIFSNRLAGNISRPIVSMNASLTGIKDGSTLLDPAAYPYEELRDMSQKINGLSKDISFHIQSLQDERDKLDYILDNMEEGILLLDEQGKILLINAAACRLFHCDRSVIGKHILHATRDVGFVRGFEQTTGYNESRCQDLRLGGRVLETRYNLVQENQRKVGGSVIVTLTDVTDSRSNQNMRREFFANASHELKTPITSIKGCAELLTSGLPLANEQVDELLGRIALESDRLSGLISDILKINRLESGAFTTARELVDIAQVVSDCRGEVQALADRQQVTIHTDITPCPVWASPRDLRELVGNLLVNAVQYNAPGGRVDIRLSCTEETALLTVRNDGDPIPPEHQKRVFERFYRVDSGRSKAVGGTGLGLSIVKHVTDELGGRLELTSNSITGTTITVELPKGQPAS